MKRSTVSVSAVAFVILLSCSASSTLNHQSVSEQDSVVSTDAVVPNSPRFLAEAVPSAEEAHSGKTEDSWPKNDYVSSGEILNDAMNVIKTSENNFQDGKVENALNSDIAPAEVPIPDGRIFYRSEPPYGYLPTCFPKQNITLPIFPPELD